MMEPLRMSDYIVQHLEVDSHIYTQVDPLSPPHRLNPALLTESNYRVVTETPSFCPTKLISSRVISQPKLQMKVLVKLDGR